MSAHLKFRIVVTIIAVSALAGVTYARGLKCWSCNGTGWKGQQSCLVCGGDGIIGN